MFISPRFCDEPCAQMLSAKYCSPHSDLIGCIRHGKARQDCIPTNTHRQNEYFFAASQLIRSAIVPLPTHKRPAARSQHKANISKHLQERDADACRILPSPIPERLPSPKRGTDPAKSTKNPCPSNLQTPD